MDLHRLRFAEQIPPASVADARCLRTLPSSWERAVPESAIDALLKRAEALADALMRKGAREARAAAELRRSVTMLRRADALHAQAERLETLAQLYLALAAFRDDLAPEDDTSIGWLQAGALPGAELTSAHGPAFRKTAALRNRAFRQLEAALARHRLSRDARGAR